MFKFLSFDTFLFIEIFGNRISNDDKTTLFCLKRLSRFKIRLFIDGTNSVNIIAP